MILTTLGTVSLTKKSAESLVKDLVKQGDLTQNEGKKFVSDLMKGVEKEKNTIEKNTEKTIKNILGKTEIPTRKEITDLKNKIEQLNKKIDKK
ncbi:phasin family protein [Candidatus Parcubacteria bacterium]|nr:phasin family protein [Candidatus Parcubacteria bacterium]